MHNPVLINVIKEWLVNGENADTKSLRYATLEYIRALEAQVRNNAKTEK